MRCNTEDLLKKVGVGKTSKKDVIDIAVLTNLPDCKKINAKNYADATESVSYNRYDIPSNQFECMREGCVNSGTLTLSTEENATATYKVSFDATEFSNGVITFYVKKAENAAYPVKGEIAISSKDDFANSDVYAFSLTEDDFAEDGFAPVAIMLSEVPASVTGEGWSAVQNGAYIRIKNVAGISGISSIAIFDEIEDFELQDSIKVSCLTGFEWTDELTAAQATCLASGYDTSSDPAPSITVRGNTATPNYNKLNPMLKRGSDTETSIIVSAEKVVEAGDNVGQIIIPDMNQDECGFASVQITSDCETTQLTRLNLPMAADIDEGHYTIASNADGSSTIYFSKEHIGRTVLVSYPQKAEVECYVADPDHIEDLRYRLKFKKTMSDGTEWIYTINNALVTSFSHTISYDSSGETEFSFTFVPQRDADGVLYHLDKIVA